MIKITILYPNKENGRFDMDYYINKHMPMSIEKFGPALKKVIIETGINAGVPGSQPPYIAICSLFFESQEAFETAFTPIMPALTADMPNYTDIDIIFQISEVKIMQ
ncbi:hypothetical protein BH11BAC6_BH11BAC6_10860 [soil metagenome]